MKTQVLIRWAAPSCLALICSSTLALGAGQTTPTADQSQTSSTPSSKAASPSTAIAGVGTSTMVRPGIVTDLQTITVENKMGGTAQVIGGIAGGAAGVWLTKDSDWSTRAIAGTAGAALGSQAAKLLAKPEQRLRITLKLDNGQIAVVEQDLEEQFQIGQRVNLVGDNANGKVRSVSP